MSRFSRVVHAWLGLCPDLRAVRARRQAEPYGTPASILPDNRIYVRNGIVVDYGGANTLTWFLIGAVVALLCTAAVSPFIVTVISFRQAGTLVSIAILVFAMVTFYRDIRKADMEVTPDTLVIRRSLHRPVVIRRDDITTVEVRDTLLAYPLRHQKLLNVYIIPALFGIIILVNYLDLVSGEITSSRFLLDLIFNINFALFFPVMYYHSGVRSVYPKNVVMTTSKKKRVAIYSQNPEELAGMLERSS